MEIFDSGFKEQDQDIALTGIRGEDDLPTAASEAFVAAYQVFESEDSFFSRERNFSNEAKARNAKIASLTGEESGDWKLYEDINPRELKQLQNDLSVLQNEDDPLLRMQASRRLSKNSKAHKAWMSLQNLRQKYPEIEDDNQLFDNIQKTILEKRESAQRAQENARTFGGKAGAVAGTLVAAMKQPETLVTLPIGYGGMGGAKSAWEVLKAMTKVAAAEGALSGATELAIQPEVFKYKQDVGADYTVSDAASNIGFATLGGATFGFLMRGAAELPLTPKQKVLDVLKDRNPSSVERDAIDIAEAAEEIARSSPFKSDTVEAQVAHNRAYEKARQDLAAGNPVDVSPIVRGVEPPLTKADIEERVSILEQQKTEAVGRGDNETLKTVNTQIENLKALSDRFSSAVEIKQKDNPLEPVMSREVDVDPVDNVKGVLESRDIDLPVLSKNADGEDVVEYRSTREIFSELDSEASELEAIKVCSLS